ncbi:LCP family protein [Candidatus Uhrbacteria bacterium]|nr:LCP family protein [Candidatus Uhrbacteria bacterium]
MGCPPFSIDYTIKKKKIKYCKFVNITLPPYTIAMPIEPPRVNLVPTEESPEELSEQHTTPRNKRKRMILVYGVSLFFVILLTFGYQIIFAEHTFFPFANIPIFRVLRSLARSGEITLKGEKEDRINVLLLGMGGAGHEGPYLTDTIILASIRPSTKQIFLLSIPRDLVVPLGNYGWRKINTANAFGELENPGNGAAFVSAALEKLLQQPIHYTVRVDFEAFRKLIDTMGGMYLTVDRAFTDTRYPTENYKYQVLTFNAGPQWFDGNRALQFARSRHGNNGEGSDFARARRQQKIIEAVKDRLFSVWTLTSPTVISTLIETFEQNVIINMNLGEMVRFARLMKNIDTRTINTIVLDTSAEGYLTETYFEGAFLLEPRTGNFDEIRTLITNIFDVQPVVVRKKISATLDVRNGTKIEGLARTVADALKKNGFTITNVANAPDQRITETFIIDQTDGKKEDAVSALHIFFGEQTSILPLPRNDGALREANPLQSPADFIIILGPNHAIHDNE